MVDKMKVIAIILTFYLAKTQAECPASCKCTRTSVSCVNQNLETIPTMHSLETSPVILDFSGNKILFIGQDDFDFPKSDEVKEVYLNHSGLADIGEGTFDNVENLQELYLGHNYLSGHSVPENMIEDLDNMVLLDMSSNYFNGVMPTIRSETLEVLALVNSKISAIPERALAHLPNLKLLLLQQNNIHSLNFEQFFSYMPNFLSVKLTLNPWTCSCENIQGFYQMANRNFIEMSDPIQCISKENNTVNIFNNSEAVGLITQCGHSVDILYLMGAVRDMVDESRKGLKNLEPQNEASEVSSYEYTDEESEKEIDINGMNDVELEAALSGSCWRVVANAYSDNAFFTVVMITSVTSFSIGFITGIIFCKILRSLRYKNLEQSSDSRVQLLNV